MTSKAVLKWLTEEEQPAVRYLTLRDLEGRSSRDSELREARKAIPTRGWANEILARRRADGTWGKAGGSLYGGKYHSTNWMLLVLADLGTDGGVREIRDSCDVWIRRLGTTDGGFSPWGGAKGHLCTTGNTARALIEFGREETPAVEHALDWLVRSAHPLGGWSCMVSGRNLDSWEALSALAAYPRRRWTAGMTRVVEQGAEFFLERELHRQGARYAPWFRFHYPVHYYYDLLVGLDLLTSLGYGDDPRLGFAIGHMKKKRGSDGRWRLAPLHPDVAGSLLTWVRTHPKQAPVPFGLETPGRPSKMITLIAERVLGRLEGTA